MQEISGSGEIHPRAQKLYIQEYRHGATLFEKALLQSNKSSTQRKEFDAVMNIALEVLNQSASALKREDLLKQNQKISNDFQAYQKDPSKQNLSILKTDLDQAKKSITQ